MSCARRRRSRNSSSICRPVTTQRLDQHLETVALSADKRADFGGALRDLAADLSEAFWGALDSIAGPGGPWENIDVIVTGALAGDASDYERAIERFARSEAEADAWFEGFARDLYEAQEHTVDADAADHITEEPGERYFNSRNGMKMVVRLRRRCEGVTWIAGHPHRKLLLSALTDLIAQSRRTPPIAELDFLLANADGWVRDQAWFAVERHWDDALGLA